MIPNSNTTVPVSRRSPWSGIVKFLFIVILTIIIFLLAQEMARHRFHGGGRINRNDTLQP
jgi:heme/copper-type cytochrome/quinol oxidase subunit 4